LERCPFVYHGLGPISEVGNPRNASSFVSILLLAYPLVENDG
jgi:hypothetical protein